MRDKPVYEPVEVIALASILLALLGLIAHCMTYYAHLLGPICY